MDKLDEILFISYVSCVSRNDLYPSNVYEVIRRWHEWNDFENLIEIFASLSLSFSYFFVSSLQDLIKTA